MSRRSCAWELQDSCGTVGCLVHLNTTGQRMPGDDGNSKLPLPSSCSVVTKATWSVVFRRTVKSCAIPCRHLVVIDLIVPVGEHFWNMTHFHQFLSANTQLKVFFSTNWMMNHALHQTKNLDSSFSPSLCLFVLFLLGFFYEILKSVHFVDAIASDESIRITPSLRSRKGKRRSQRTCVESVYRFSTAVLSLSVSLQKIQLKSTAHDKINCFLCWYNTHVDKIQQVLADAEFMVSWHPLEKCQPLLCFSVGWLNLSTELILTEERTSLFLSVTSHSSFPSSGRVWAKNVNNNENWEIEVIFRISGRGRVGADGLVSLKLCQQNMTSLATKIVVWFGSFWTHLCRLSGLRSNLAWKAQSSEVMICGKVWVSSSTLLTTMDRLGSFTCCCTPVIQNSNGLFWNGSTELWLETKKKSLNVNLLSFSTTIRTSWPCTMMVRGLMITTRKYVCGGWFSFNSIVLWCGGNEVNHILNFLQRWTEPAARRMFERFQE